MKGIVETLLADFRLEQPVQYVPTKRPDLHPGQSAQIMLGDEVVGLIGRLHPRFEQDQSIPETYIFELNLEALMLADRSEMTATPAPKFPSVTRDIAVQVATTVANAEIEAIIAANGGKFLRDTRLFDVYSGVKVAPGQKSLAYTLTYRRDDQTLTEDEVNNAFAKIVAALETQVGAQIR